MGISLGKIDLSEDAPDHPFVGGGVFFIRKPPAPISKDKPQSTNHADEIMEIANSFNQAIDKNK